MHHFFVQKTRDTKIIEYNAGNLITKIQEITKCSLSSAKHYAIFPEDLESYYLSNEILQFYSIIKSEDLIPNVAKELGHYEGSYRRFHSEWHSIFY